VPDILFVDISFALPFFLVYSQRRMKPTVCVYASLQYYSFLMSKNDSSNNLTVPSSDPNSTEESTE